MVNLTANSLAEVIHAHTDRTEFIIAYSGGVDSHVLLHCMAVLRQQYPRMQLSAVHVNHALQSEADQWQQHCQVVCDALSIPLNCFQLELSLHPGDSVEAVARKARYSKIAELMTARNCLLTGHNENDQAETCLIQLKRGAGVKGLAAMPVSKPFARGICIRPLLSVSRDVIEAYATAASLQWIEDGSNQDCRFDRNFIRQQLLPLMQHRWPGVVSAIARATQHCATAHDLLHEYAAIDFQQIQTDDPQQIAIAPLLRLSEPRQANVLRYWLAALNLSMPSEKQLQEILYRCILAGPDAQPKVEYANIRLERSHDRQQLIVSKNQ